MTDEVADVDKPAVYEDADGTIVYRSSALLHCNNALLAARLGMTGAAPPPDMQARYDEGHRQEAVILAQLEQEYGFKCYAHQQTVEIKVGSALIRGHIDALSELTGCGFSSIDGVELADHFMLPFNPSGLIAVVDAKALAPAGFDLWAKEKFEKYLYYLWQQATYDYGLGFDGIVMAVKNKVTGELRADFFSTAWLKQRLPLGTIMARVLWVEKQARKGPPALFEVKCSPVQYPCPFFKMHPADMKKAPAPKVAADEGVVAQVEESATKRTELKATIKQAEGDLAECEKRIVTLMGGKESSMKMPDVGTISLYHSGGSATDWDAIAMEVGGGVEEVKAKFTIKTKSPKLSIRVTPKKVKAD